MRFREQVNAYLEAASTELKSLSYDELAALADEHASGAVQAVREVQFAGKKAYLETILYKCGPMRKHVSVEVLLATENDAGKALTASVYFERFKSGRLHVPRFGLLGALAYVGGSLALVYLLLRYLILRP